MSLLSRILDLLFPPRCPFCGALLDHSLPGPCPRCEEANLWFPPGQGVFPGQAFSRCVCVGWYRDFLRESILQFKFHNHPKYARAYGPMLAKAIRTYLPGTYDCITWAPVSSMTLKSRGYDQSRLLAEATAEALNTQALPLLEKKKHNVPQSSLQSGRQRWANVVGVYTVPHPEQVRGRRILVIDDILTTGATLEECAKTLRNHGAIQVVAATFCKTPEKIP